MRLFDRISRRFSITEAGRRFYQYARQMDALYGDMDREMRGWNTRGLLRVGCSITVGSRMMPKSSALLEKAIRKRKCRW